MIPELTEKPDAMIFYKVGLEEDHLLINLAVKVPQKYYYEGYYNR